LLVAAGLGPPCEHALISLLALNGLRATSADIEHLGVERGHRTLLSTAGFMSVAWHAREAARRGDRAQVPGGHAALT
jgi:hypothetical protein